MAVHEARRQQFARRRDVLCAGLDRLGFEVPLRPAGAFYVYVDIGGTGMDALAFCRRLLEEYRVAVTPGIDFGAHRAERYVRFAFTTSEAHIELGIERIGAALADWGVG